MKRIICLLLTAALLLSLTACGAGAGETTAPATQEPETTAAPTVPETTVPVETAAPIPVSEDGFLYLTVSKITFTLAGESEDIYIGTIPRENVTWGSMDESIVTFQEGVLTAVGVGETTVFAEYGDQRIECTAGCIAKTEEDLAEVDMKTIRSPKRYPPLVTNTEPTFYDDAAIIGDSIGYIMFQWHSKLGGLGKPLFLCRGGTSINGFVRNYKKIYYKGAERALEDALADSGVKKAFIMLGQNDLGYMTVEQTIENWGNLLTRIRSKNPDLEIYIQSCIPEWKDDRESNSQNEKIDQHNILLETFAAENDCHFIDLGQYAEDHANKMPTQYSMDKGIHMNEEGCKMWIQVLQAYAEYLALKGETQ